MPDRAVPDRQGAPTARAAVADLFEAWAADRGLLVDPGIVAHVLHHKWRCGDGDLRHWTAAEFPRIYDAWRDRARCVDRAALAVLGPTMVAFVDFLDDLGWLEAGGPTRWDVRALVTGLSVRLVDALTDCAQSDLLARRLRGASADIGDRAVQDRLLAVAARHLVEHYPPPPLDPTLLPLMEPHQVAYRPTRWMHQPVTLAPGDRLERQATGSPALWRLRRFTLWAGTSPRLTARGNLRVADAVEAASVLGVYQRDVRQFSGGGRIPSSTRLGETHFTFLWAKAVGLVRAENGRLGPTLLGAVLVDRPLELAGRALAVLCTAGLRAHRVGGPHGQGRLVDTPPHLLRALVETLYATQAALDFTSFLSRIDGFPGLLDGPEVTRRRDGLCQLVAVLEDLGVLDSVGGHTEHAPDGSRRRWGGLVSLTPLGTWCVHRLLRTEGLPAPVLGELRDFDATTLLEMCAGYDDEAAAAEADRWRRVRGAHAAAELADAVRGGHPGSRMNALAAMSGLGEEAEAAVRSLLDEPRIRPFALMWLIDHGLEGQEAFAPEDVAHLLVEAMVSFLNEDPDKAVYVFSRDRSEEDQIVDIAHVWRLDNPYAVPLLEAIAQRHPNDRVAHAAQVALRTR